MGSGGVMLALFRAALAWDGAYQLTIDLVEQAPFVVYGRFVTAPFHLAAILASKATTDLGLISGVFSASYAMPPVLALLASCWMVLRERPSLVIWPFFGICLACLPGQFFVLSEAIMACQLGWPVLLWLLVGAPPRRLPLALACAVFVFVVHPASVPLFTACAGAAAVTGWRSSGARGRLWGAALVLISAAGARYATIRGGYEMATLDAELFRAHFETAVEGLPGISLLGGFGAAVTTLLLPRVRGGRRMLLLGIGGLGLALAGGALLLYVREARLWGAACNYRSWVAFVSLAFMGLAFLDAVLPAGGEPGTPIGAPRHLQAVALASIFLIVLSIQGSVWSERVEWLRRELASRPPGCVSLRQLGLQPGDPLFAWTTPSLAVLVQGRTPRVLVLERDEDCRRLDYRLFVPLAPWEVLPRWGNWFDLGQIGL